MNVEEIVPNGDETVAESVENTESTDDNDIRELLAAQLAESEDPPQDEESEQHSEEPSEDGAESPTVEDDVPVIPQSLTQEEREAWNETPQPVRDAFSRREKEFQAGLKSDAELQKVITPLAERLEGSGVHVDQYVQNLLRADEAITQNPLGVVMSIVQKHGLQDQLPQGEQARLAVNGRARPCLGRLSTQDADGVPPQCRKQSQLFAEVEALIIEPFDVEILVRTHQQRAVHRDGPHYPIGEKDLGVGDVADTFDGTPLTGDGTGQHVLRGHAHHGRSQVIDPLVVDGEQLGVAQ